MKPAAAPPSNVVGREDGSSGRATKPEEGVKELKEGRREAKRRRRRRRHESFLVLLLLSLSTYYIVDGRRSFVRSLGRSVGCSPTLASLASLLRSFAPAGRFGSSAPCLPAAGATQPAFVRSTQHAPFSLAVSRTYEAVAAAKEGVGPDGAEPAKAS